MRSASHDVVTMKLIEDGARHLFGDRLIETGCPVHILHGTSDESVPWRLSTALVSRLASDDVVLTLVKDGDHRLSRPEDIERLIAAVVTMRAEIQQVRSSEQRISRRCNEPAITIRCSLFRYWLPPGTDTGGHHDGQRAGGGRGRPAGDSRHLQRRGRQDDGDLERRLRRSRQSPAVVRGPPAAQLSGPRRHPRRSGDRLCLLRRLPRLRRLPLHASRTRSTSPSRRGERAPPRPSSSR